jgi:hypothetical protein
MGNERAKLIFLPGSAREISRLYSAARDTPVLEYSYGPNQNVNLGFEIGGLALILQSVSLRLGMYGMVAIEDVPHFWRGLEGFSLGLSLDGPAQKKLGPRGAFEITLIGGHESDHRSDQTPFNSTPHAGDIPAGGGGNHIGLDLAGRFPLGSRFDLIVRVLDRFFFAGPLQQAPAIDLTLRCQALPWLFPTLGVFAEGLIQNQGTDGYSVRGLLGLGVRGKLGELMPFGTADVGNGKGLLINFHEVRLTIGVRYVPF